jgi:hypothetical protein
VPAGRRGWAPGRQGNLRPPPAWLRLLTCAQSAQGTWSLACPMMAAGASDTPPTANRRGRRHHLPLPADWVHVDMFDGSMVANFTIGPPVLKSLRQHSSMFMDCHLAVNVGAAAPADGWSPAACGGSWRCCIGAAALARPAAMFGGISRPNSRRLPVPHNCRSRRSTSRTWRRRAATRRPSTSRSGPAARCCCCCC